MGDLSNSPSFVCLFNNLFISVLAHGHSFYTLSYNFILVRLFQVWPLGALFADSCVPLTQHGAWRGCFISST